jgi:exosome complex component RRP42
MLKPEKEYVKKMIEEGSRLNGRGFFEFRDIEIEVGIYPKAEGSARVRIGDTLVAVGVKLSVEQPFPDSLDKGILIVSAEFPPIASPEFEPGPPGEDAIELARVVDRGIRESECIDFEKLCIKAGEKVWTIYVDIHVLNHDGNLIDASALGAIAALLNAKMPKYDEENDVVIYSEKTGSLPINDKPVAITIGKVSGKLLVDLDAKEEEALEARITITTTQDGKICAMQKGQGGFFSFEEIKEALDIAIEKGNELREILNKVIEQS